MAAVAHVQRFCVIAQARSGSEYLTTRLNEHPDIACHRELYNRRNVYSALTGALKKKLPAIEWRDAHPLEALEQVVALSQEAFPDKRVFGFKLFLNHDKAVRKHVREQPGYRLVVLERRNKLAQHVSTLTARQTGRWSAFADKPQAAPADAPAASVHVDIDELARFVELEQQRYTQFNERIASRAGVIHLHSEEIDARLPEVLQFLEVDVAPELRVVRLRQNPSRLADRVANWPEVVDWLGRNHQEDWANS
jgi:LPS sulfotransferase NodH